MVELRAAVAGMRGSADLNLPRTGLAPDIVAASQRAHDGLLSVVFFLVDEYRLLTSMQELSETRQTIKDGTHLRQCNNTENAASSSSVKSSFSSSLKPMI